MEQTNQPQAQEAYVKQPQAPKPVLEQPQVTEPKVKGKKIFSRNVGLFLMGVLCGISFVIFVVALATYV